MRFAKLKAIYVKPEVKATIYIVGGFSSVILFVWMLVNFTDFTIVISILSAMFYMLYMLWKNIVEEIKKSERRKSNQR